MDKGTTYRLQFKGHLGIENRRTCPVLSTVEFELHDPSTLSIDLLLIGDENENRAAYFILSHPLYNYLWLYSSEKDKTSVEVLGIHGITTGDTHATIRAAAVQIGISDEPLEKDTTYLVRVELTPSGILVTPGIREASYTGDVRFQPIVVGSIDVSTELGTLQVGERYAHHESEEYGNRIRHTVNRVSITGKISVGKGHSLSSAHENLRKEIENVCTLISFCYRQPVDYYEVEYWPEPVRFGNKSLLRRRRDSFEKKIDQDELINFRGLIGGGLDRLLRTFKDSGREEELSRAIRFLSSSYKIATLESSYFLAYSALDLAASIHDPESLYLVGSAKWKKVQKQLRDYLNTIAESAGIADVLEQIKEKLPELRRASGDRRIIEACDKLGVKTSNLWPSEGFEAGLKSATRMRNELFHSALCESPLALSEHLVRVRSLVERLLLKLLQWPDDQVWTWHDQNLLWINSRRKDE
jgi:hypothetical protein